MKVIAERPGQLLIALDDGTDKGQILDLDQHAIFPPMPIGSIAARGYWTTEVTTKPAAVIRILRDVQHIPADSGRYQEAYDVSSTGYREIEVEAYDPDQPRDERGRWTGGGGGSQSAAGAQAGGLRGSGGLPGGAGGLAAPSRADPRYGEADWQPLDGLPTHVKIPGVGEVEAGPNPAIRAIAREYTKQAGIEYDPPKTYVKVDKERAARIADEYDQMKDDPHDPKVAAAYSAMIKETTAQYKALVDAGLKVEFIDYAKQGDPYAASPRLAIQDINQHSHMWVFSTRDGFGSDSSFDPSKNPLLAETSFKISGQTALANDLFRAVHDVFGHAKEGNGMRAEGEENAWRSHSAMYSPLARQAMTSETRGQNSWVNYGPYGESNRTASGAATHYADQKVGIMPSWTVTDGAHDVREAFVPLWQLLQEDWDEDKHPRGEHGKFTSGGGGGSAGAATAPSARVTITPAPPHDSYIAQGSIIHALGVVPKAPSPQEADDQSFQKWYGHQSVSDKDQAREMVVNHVATNLGKSLLASADPEVVAIRNAMLKGVPAAKREAAMAAKAEQYVRDWAMTSGDTRVTSLAFQRLVVEQFGATPPTGHMAANMATLKPEIDAYLAKEGPIIKAVLHTQYQWTQQELAASGIKEVTVFRGVGANAPQGREASSISLQPLSSFTSDYKMAREYSMPRQEGATPEGLAGNRRGNSDAAIVAMRVPAARIFSTAKTGFGIFDQGETLVLGGRDLPATVKWGTWESGDVYTFPATAAGLVRGRR